MIGGKPFEAIAVGDSASLVRRITPQDVARFVEMTGDDNPLHVDRAYAETTPFKDVVVHGLLGASFISTLIGTKLPGEGALWVSQSFDFLLPVRLDDELTISVTVREKHARERLLGLEAQIVNQHRQVVLTGAGKVKLLEPRPAEAPAAGAARARVALVTGGAGGIGREVCQRLAAEGFQVVLNYRGSEARAAETVAAIGAAGGEAIAVQADISRPEEARALVERAVRAYGPVSLLVNNAAPRIHATAFDDLDWQDLALHLDVQLKGAFLLAQAVVPGMKAAGHGRIVTITSQVADAAPTPGWTAYAVAKAALATFTRCLAAELGPAGITVNNVSPGLTDTAYLGDLSEKARLIAARQAPLRRLAGPRDVAGAVAFLASDAADYITGETLRVNGGTVMV